MKLASKFLNKLCHLNFVAFFIAFIVAVIFYEPLIKIVNSWQKDEYSYAYLIPPLAFLLGLHRLSKNRLTPAPTWLGTAMVAAGILLHLPGQLSGVTVVPQYGFFITLLGIFLAFGGKKIFFLLLPILFYLFFAIPLPTTFYITISAKLQLLSSVLGGQILQILGFSVFQEGNIIDLGGYKLQVVEACSGLRYIFPLLSFSYLVAYFYNDCLWKKIVLFISAIPIAILLNVTRIAIVGITVNYWGISAAEGLLHLLEGWAVFSICVLLLFSEAWLFQTLGNSKGRLDLSSLSLPHGPYFSGPLKLNGACYSVLVLFLCIGIGQAAGLLTPRAAIIPQRSAFSDFPAQIGPWQGTPETLTTSEVDLLKVSDYLNLSLTQTRQNLQLSFFVAYYNTQRDNSNLHSPEMCIPGGGWKIISSSIHHINLPQNSQHLYVNRALIQKGLNRQLVYYWFEQNGQSRANRFAIKWLTIKNSLTTGRTDSAILRLSTPVNSKESEEEADQRLQSFFREVLPILPNYIPDYLSPD